MFTRLIDGETVKLASGGQVRIVELLGLGNEGVVYKVKSGNSFTLALQYC